MLAQLLAMLAQSAQLPIRLAHFTTEIHEYSHGSTECNRFRLKPNVMIFMDHYCKAQLYEPNERLLITDQPKMLLTDFMLNLMSYGVNDSLDH